MLNNTPTIKPRIEYPCLKQLTKEFGEIVVMFYTYTSGTIVSSTDTFIWPLGYYSDNWDESEFKLFGGTIELRND